MMLMDHAFDGCDVVRDGLHGVIAGSAVDSLLGEHQPHVDAQDDSRRRVGRGEGRSP
jgi:hypothetical protein